MNSLCSLAGERNGVELLRKKQQRMKTLLLTITLALVSSAFAGDVDIYDSHGRWISWAERNGSEYNIYDNHSSYQGWMERNGNQFDVYNRNGGYRGWVDQNGYISAQSLRSATLAL